MRYILFAILLTALTATSAYCQVSIDSARSVRVLDERLASHKLGEYLHGTTLLHLWGSWCSECMEAYPAYNRLVQTLMHDSLNVVNVAIEMNGTRHWKRVSQRVGTGLQLYVDGRRDASGEYLNLDWIKSFPAYILVGKNGAVIQEWYTLPSAPEIQSVLRQAPR